MVLHYKIPKRKIRILSKLENETSTLSCWAQPFSMPFNPECSSHFDPSLMDSRCRCAPIWTSEGGRSGRGDLEHGTRAWSRAGQQPLRLHMTCKLWYQSPGSPNHTKIKNVPPFKEVLLLESNKCLRLQWSQLPQKINWNRICTRNSSQ